VNFDLDDQQDLLDKTLQRFVQHECPPARVRAAFEAESSFDPGLWAKLAELGLFGIAVDEQDGGAGLGVFELVLAADVFGAAALPGPFLEHVLATLAVAWAGDSEQRTRWLPSLLSGTCRSTIAWAEAGEGWLPQDWTVRGPVLRGDKRGVLHADGAELVVIATPDGFHVVEAPDTALRARTVDPLDRTRRVYDLRLDSVSAERLPGNAIDRVFDVGLLLLAADAAGGARRCLEIATEYALTREQFGVTIGHFQAVKHQLANMAVEALPLRHLAWYAAAATDAGRADAPKLIALAKSHATDRYVQIARQTVDLFGGIGYTWECDVHFYLKRAVFDRTVFGRPERHRARVAAFNGWPTRAAVAI
jgi:alkylation response protein AidB-like acyl-CoA dehydrogenase